MDIRKFVSPVYLQRKAPHRDDVERYEGAAVPISEDTLERWLSENLVNQKFGGLGRLESGMIFDGIVLCEVRVGEEVLKSHRGGSGPLSDYAYRKTVEVRIHPNGKRLIPETLNKKLMDKAYVEETGESS